MIGSEDLADSDVARIQKVIIETEADQVIEKEIKGLTTVALRELETSSLKKEALEALRELALSVAYRSY